MAGRSTSKCALTGGDEKRPGAASGYVQSFRSVEETSLAFHNADAAVVAAAFASFEPSPCGYLYSIVSALAITAPLMETLRMPVLIMLGDHDVAEPFAADVEHLLMLGNKDVSITVMPDTGHCSMLGRTAPTFRELLNEWLGARGF